MKKLYYIIIMLLIFGCSKSKISKTYPEIIFSEIASSKISDIFDFEESKFIFLEPDTNSILSDNLNIKITDEDIFVLDYDQKKILRFDTEGRFMNEIGQMGPGPGEFMNPCGLFVDESKQIVEILSEPFTRVIQYNFDGQYINQFDFGFPSQSFIKGNNGEYYFYRGVNSASEPYRVTVTDSSKILFNHLKDIGNPAIGHIMEKEAFSKNSKSIFLMESLLPIIYNLSGSEILEEVSLDYGPKTITEDQTSQFSSVMDFFKKIDTQGFYCINGIASSDQTLILKIVYQEVNKDLEYYYLFQSLTPDFPPKIINCGSDSTCFLSLSKMHKFHKDNLVFSINPFDFINSNLKNSFPSHFFENYKYQESDNPIILLMKLKT